jgi:hypothetical protein
MVLKVNDRTTAFKWIYYNFFAGVEIILVLSIRSGYVILLGYILDKKKIYIKV